MTTRARSQAKWDAKMAPRPYVSDKPTSRAGAGDASPATQRAEDMSKIADRESGSRGNPQRAVAAHKAAADAHLEAAAVHTEAGNDGQAAKHMAKAKEHAQAAGAPAAPPAASGGAVSPYSTPANG